MIEADRIIAELGLEPHPEGGHYRQIFKDAPGQDGRARSTAIYYLLRAGEVSRPHRIDAVEIWHYYRGAPLELSIKPEGGELAHYVLGAAIEKGERPQIIVPPHGWQAARSLGEYTLVGCTVAPGFLFETFEMAPPEFELR